MRYKATFGNISVSGAQDLLEILCPSDAVLELISVRVGQSSDAGDSQAEMLRVEFVRGEGSVTSGSGGSSVTPVPLEKGQPASGCTVERNNTTRMAAGTGSLKTMYEDAFNVQVGFLYQPVPEEREWVSPGDRLTIALPAAPADALTMSATVVWDEHGG